MRNKKQNKLKFKLFSRFFFCFILTAIFPITLKVSAQTVPSGTIQPNKDLDLTKSHHLVMAYELSTGEFSRLRIEPFFQYLYDVPVMDGTSFSMIMC